MENDFKIAFIISILLHSGIFLATSFSSKKIIYVNIPVDLFFYTTPAPPKPAVEPAPKPEEEEIIIPKKIKKKKPKKKIVEKKPEPKKEVEKKPEPAIEALVPPQQLAPSSQITLDTAEFPYTYYTNMIVRKIRQRWQWSVEFGRLKTVIYFTINQDGSIGNTDVKTQSGDRIFDQQAIRAIKLAAPFPPLPFTYDEDSLGVFFEFSFKE